MSGYYSQGTSGVDDYAMDRDPYTVERQEQIRGVNFGTDLTKIGRSGSGAFGVQQKDVVSEEKRLIDKVFMIVDADRSGQIEKQELRDMFSIFDKDKADMQFLDGALDRIWQNVMKARASGDMGESMNQGGEEQISPAEFYNILSKKFTKDDPKREMENVFHKMNKSGSRDLDVEEIFEISQLLGEDCPRHEVTEMFKLFNSDYRRQVEKWDKYRRYFKEAMEIPEYSEKESAEKNQGRIKWPIIKKEGEVQKKAETGDDIRRTRLDKFKADQDKCKPKDPKSISIDDFIEVMKADLKTPFPDPDGEEEMERRTKEESQYLDRRPPTFRDMLNNPSAGGGSSLAMGQTASIDSKGTGTGSSTSFFGNPSSSKKRTTGNALLDDIMKLNRMESWVEVVSMYF